MKLRRGRVVIGPDAADEEEGAVDGEVEADVEGEVETEADAEVETEADAEVETEVDAEVETEADAEVEEGLEREDEEAACTYNSVEAFVDRLGTIGEAHDAAIQAFDARYVAGRGHLESAVEHANRAFERGENVADDRAVEILLYAAGRRQIDRAMEMGVGEGAGRVVVVIDGGDETEAAAAVERAICQESNYPASGPEATDATRIRDFFDITDAELAASTADLEALVQERVALLDVEK